MKRSLLLLGVLLLFSLLPMAGAAPLRVFIRAGQKSTAHGPGEHDHPRFLSEFSELLRSRGVVARGALRFPTAEELHRTDVLVLYAADAASIEGKDRQHLEAFLERGGGLVVLHNAVCGQDPHWFTTIAGGAWEYGRSKYYHGEISWYYDEKSHPIIDGASNFDVEDELYYDVHLHPQAEVLATSYAPDPRNTKDGKVLPSVYEVVPQMWIFEGKNHRAFTSLLGHRHATLQLPHYQAILLRGIAWAGKRQVDVLLSPAEVARLRYPKGGPTMPSKSGQSIVIEKGFELQLVAAEPWVQKPISMEWDDRGRLWVAETPEYPHGRRVSQGGVMVPLWGEKDPHKFKPVGEVVDRPARDRVSILEDTNGDHQVDRKLVFAEGLELITSLVLYKDGAIVAQPPEVLWIRDLNADGRADLKQVLYTGLGVFDTHAVLSNLRWGMDGWIYGTVGYAGGEIRSAVTGQEFGKITAGVVRFLPEGEKFEQVVSHGGNIWGMDFSWEGELFYSQANYFHLNHAVLTEAILSRGRLGTTPAHKNIEDHKKTFPIRDYKQAYIQIDNVGGFTAASGSCFYTGGAWPESFNSTHYLSEPTVNLVHQDVVTPAGVSYLARTDDQQEFLASTDLWFRPIHQRVGPDGALYILDFYNQAAVHNDTRGPRHGPNNAAVRPDRDHYFGRIWRVQHQEARTLPVPRFDSTSGLIQTLQHPNGWARQTAHRLLMEKAPRRSAPALRRLLASGKASTAGKLHALWVLSLQDGLRTSDLLQALESNEPALQKNALHLVLTSNARQELLPQVLALVKSPNERVRLLAAAALGSYEPNAEIVPALLEVFAAAKDPWTQSAVIGAGSRKPAPYLLASLEFPGADNRLSPLQTSLAEKMARQSDQDISGLVQEIARRSGNTEARALIVRSLASRLQGRPPVALDSNLKSALQLLLRSDQLALSASALALAGRWDVKKTLEADMENTVPQALKAFQEAATDEQKIRWMELLAGIWNVDPQILSTVLQVIGADSAPAPLRLRAIELAGDIPHPDVGRYLTEYWPSFPPALKETALQQLLKRPEWVLAFVRHLDKGGIPSAQLGPMAMHRLRTYGDKQVSAEANRVLDRLRGPEAAEKEALIAALQPQVNHPGNPTKGKLVFQQNCANCHKFQGEGNGLAPDLTGMGTHGKSELLVHVLDPNRVVEPNYLAYSAETADGESFDGILVRENRSGVVLRNATGETEISRGQLKELRNTGLSLMPNGFEALGPEALRDLLAYLVNETNAKP